MFTCKAIAALAAAPVAVALGAGVAHADVPGAAAAGDG
jgi:hypothetical protein